MTTVTTHVWGPTGPEYSPVSPPNGVQISSVRLVRSGPDWKFSRKYPRSKFIGYIWCNDAGMWSSDGSMKGYVHRTRHGAIAALVRWYRESLVNS